MNVLRYRLYAAHAVSLVHIFVSSYSYGTLQKYQRNKLQPSFHGLHFAFITRGIF